MHFNTVHSLYQGQDEGTGVYRSGPGHPYKHPGDVLLSPERTQCVCQDPPRSKSAFPAPLSLPGCGRPLPRAFGLLSHVACVFNQFGSLSFLGETEWQAFLDVTPVRITRVHTIKPSRNLTAVSTDPGAGIRISSITAGCWALQAMTFHCYLLCKVSQHLTFCFLAFDWEAWNMSHHYDR
jgi:hypothetical protein